MQTHNEKEQRKERERERKEEHTCESRRMIRSAVMHISTPLVSWPARSIVSISSTAKGDRHRAWPIQFPLVSLSSPSLYSYIDGRKMRVGICIKGSRLTSSKV